MWIWLVSNHYHLLISPPLSTRHKLSFPIKSNFTASFCAYQFHVLGMPLLSLVYFVCSRCKICYLSSHKFTTNKYGNSSFRITYTVNLRVASSLSKSTRGLTCLKTCPTARSYSTYASGASTTSLISATSSAATEVALEFAAVVVVESASGCASRYCAITTL